MQFTHAYQTQIRKIRTAVSIAAGEIGDSRYVISEGESRLNQSGTNEVDYKHRVAEVEGCFGENCFASEQWLNNPSSNVNCPFVVKIGAISECNEKTGICNPFHFFE